MLKKILPRTLSALALGVAVAAVPTLTSATHSWNGYHWARTVPQFTLKLGNNLTTSAWQTRLAQTSSDWNSGNTPILTAVVAGTSTKRCRMVPGTTQVCNGKYGNNGWLGLASINITGVDHITQGTAKMNDTYFDTPTYNNVNEREHVMCQEVAHTFGLAHQSEDGSSQNSCMDYFSNTGANAGSTISTKPNSHDYAELNEIYSHLDSTTTVSALAPLAESNAVDVSDDHASWGQLISQSRRGQSSIYERHNRDGSRTLTHVFWTLEAVGSCETCDHRYDR